MKGRFQQAIWPLIAIAALFGFALFEYPVGKPRRLLSLIYAIVPVGLQFAMYEFRKNCFYVDDQIFRRSIFDRLMGCCITIAMMSVCLTHWHGKRYCRCLDAINEVDAALAELGFRHDFSKLRRVMVVALTVWTLWSTFLVIVDGISFSKLIQLHPGYIALGTVVLNAPLHLLMVVDMLFWFLLGHAGTGFDRINDFLKELASTDNDPGMTAGWFRGNAITYGREMLVPDEKDQRTLWAMMHLHFRLMGVTRDINRVLQMQISLLTILSCMCILVSMIFTFRMILLPFEGDKFQTVTQIWLWSISFFVKIVTTNHVCETVSGKAASISDATVNMLHLIDDARMREDVSLIILQAKHKPLRFSSLGLSYFGYQFAHEIFASIVTVTVILLQMKTGLD